MNEAGGHAPLHATKQKGTPRRHVSHPRPLPLFCYYTLTPFSRLVSIFRLSDEVRAMVLRDS